jgi:hypothetical protein
MKQLLLGSGETDDPDADRAFSSDASESSAWSDKNAVEWGARYGKLRGD